MRQSSSFIYFATVWWRWTSTESPLCPVGATLWGVQSMLVAGNNFSYTIYVVLYNWKACTCKYTFSCQTVKTKEEKEVLEHFSGVVSWCLHLHSSLRLLPLSLSLPPLFLSLCLPLISPLSPSLFLSLSHSPSPPTHPSVHHDEYVDVQGDLHWADRLSCWAYPVQLCPPDHPQLLPG